MVLRFLGDVLLALNVAVTNPRAEMSPAVQKLEGAVELFGTAGPGSGGCFGMEASVVPGSVTALLPASLDSLPLWSGLCC